jgi:ABC-type ATPase involved in cell division
MGFSAMKISHREKHFLGSFQGQQQKGGMSRAVVTKPKLILANEQPETSTVLMEKSYESAY